MVTSMDAATRFTLLDALFAEARDLPDDALRGFLSDVQDPSLRAELNELILQDRAGTPTIRALLDIGIVLDEASEPTPIPETIGGYAVLSLVGHGKRNCVARATTRNGPNCRGEGAGERCLESRCAFAIPTRGPLAWAP